MNQTIKEATSLSFKKNQVVFLANSKESDLFFIQSGKLMICVMKGSEIIPLAYLGQGEFLGELSFFDHKPRSATVIALEESILLSVSTHQGEKQIPSGILTMARSLTKKVRYNDELIRKHGLRKRHIESIAPLSIEEQTHFYQVIKKHQEGEDQ